MRISVDAFRSVAWVAWAAIAVGAFGVGRGEIVAPGAADASPSANADANQGVYVRESAVAMEKLALAQRMEAHREWNKSADVYQEILENYPDRVVRVPRGAGEPKKAPPRYVSVAAVVQERLSRWPSEGLDVYRARYETPAATLLREAGGAGSSSSTGRAGSDDLSALHRVFARYFVTDSGKAAGLLLVDHYFESGDFAASAWVADRLLRLHPSLVAERPMMLYRAALAHHLSGNAARAAELLKQLQTDHPHATGQIRGRDVVLADSLAQELKLPAPSNQQQAVADSWPMFGGSPDRARISSASGRPGAKLFSIELSSSGGGAPKWAQRRLSAEQRKDLELTEQRDRESGMMLGVMPAVDRGELFFQDGARLYAVSLESGVPLPGWSATYGGGGDRPAGQYVLGGAGVTPLPRNQQLTVTVADDRVLAIMGQPDRLAMMMGLLPPANVRPGVPGQAADDASESRLVCLDRATGRQRWNLSPAQLPVAALKSTRFTGSPIVIADNVYLICRGGKGMQFEDCYVVCLDLDGGTYRWSCYIASASTADQMWGGETISFDQASHLAYASGRLYVLTNLGALAAVDAYSGAIEWLTIYPRDVVNDFEEGLIRLRGARRAGGGTSSGVLDARPWTQNPPMIADGKVFILPTDSPFILVYDAATGAEIQRIRLSDLRNCDTLLSVSGSRMIVAGESLASGRAIGVLFSFNWQTYQFGSTTDRSAAQSGVLYWRQELSTPIRGRGFVTTDSVFIPTAERLFRIGIRNGKVEESYPRYPGTWEKGEGPGNVLVAQDQVIIAGSRRVDVFTDMQVARAKLDAQVASNPNDPEPRLRYAEVMFVAGERDLALEKLDEAIALLGGGGGGGAAGGEPTTLPASASSSARDRVFNDALTFAKTLSDENKPESIAMAAELFDRAAMSAASPIQQVNYRVSRAAFASSVRDYPAAVALYQDVLSNPELRQVPLSDRSDVAGGHLPARVVAERAIDALIKSAGAQCYAPFEQQALSMLNEARQSGDDPAKLLEVAQVFPNAGVAPQAMLAAADAFERADDPRQATQVLRRAYLRYPGSPQRLAILESMVRDYLKMPGRLEVAIARLAQIVKADGSYRLSQPLPLPDGEALAAVDATTASEALEVLRASQQREQDKRLPDFHLPLPASPPQKQPAPFLDADAAGDASPPPIGPVDMLVLPVREHARHDRIVTYTSPTLGIYKAGAARPLATSDAFAAEAPAQCAWLEDGRLLAWNAGEIALLSEAAAADNDNNKAATIWKTKLAALKPLEVAELDDSVAGPGLGPAGIPGGNVVVVAPGGLGQAPILDNQVVIVANNDLIRRQLIARRQMARMAAMPAVMQDNAADGDGDGERVVHVRPLQDSVIVGTSSGRILALDLDDGSIAWQTRPTPYSIVRLLASDDFVVALLSDEPGMSILALDAFEGRMVNRWSFSRDSGVFPVNLALSSGGMLVFTLPDRICGKDLFEPGPQMSYQEPPNDRAAGNMLYQGAGGEGQLLIDDGRILAVSDSGQFVRVHSLETGKLIESMSDGSDSGGGGSVGLLKTEARNWNVWLRTAGPHLYVVGQQSLIAYNLDHPDQSWSKIVDSSTNENFQDAFVGQDYLVLIDQPSRTSNADRNPLPQGMPPGMPGMIPPGMANGNAADAERDDPYRLLAFSRAKIKRDNRESGLWVVDKYLTDAIKPNQWQAVEGGFYFLGKDNQLRFLRGARQEPLDR